AWEIPATDETAINGYWVHAPGDALLGAIKQAFPNITLIAEDLGVITLEVSTLRDKYALPGMKILQFAFGGQDDNPYLPHNTEENSVVYTGTHDNDTSLGWYQSSNEFERHYFEQYVAGYAADTSLKMPFSLVSMALSSKAQLAIIPMQDILELGTEHRMNIPGTALDNWRWRFEWKQLKSRQKKQMKTAIKKSQRA
ncbi:MAG: 4-alpha-glucanotransferase, partial [Methylophilaceae bacterium]|nr:4-alpha-glucanotransferase [Methylophilaceae bacterium]